MKNVKLLFVVTVLAFVVTFFNVSDDSAKASSISCKYGYGTFRLYGPVRNHLQRVFVYGGCKPRSGPMENGRLIETYTRFRW